MLVMNKGWIIRKTALGRQYVANELTGEFLDINDTTHSILCIIRNNNCSLEQLIIKLCELYDVESEYIKDDVNECVRKLNSFGVVEYE